ncbi:hypothetical protein [Pedobacter hiemivivus]|uniref:Uncharacterized protein n=1 Tax=Pedobacter hiemivivus TaxID=2530454 RepID=A0A4R0NC48_9SPHI|nr:hypothetical protein [Pedobacter hiemivivus]TCC97207.1 hypothetical protein EZ444_10175 [Pedobacter hiemivivus]
MMKSVLITIIAMILTVNCFSQDCKKIYEEIKNSSFKISKKTGTLPTDTTLIDKYIELIDKNKNACRINRQQWNIIFTNWKEFKYLLKDYLNIVYRHKNDADDIRIKKDWRDFQNLIIRSEEQLFVSNDNTLIRAIERVGNEVKCSLIKTVDDKSNEVKEIIRDTVVNQSKLIKKFILDTVVTNQDSIKYFLYKRDTTIRNSINLHGYDQNFYGLSYLQVFNPKNNSAPNAFAALAEIITSFDSFKLRNTGAFLSAGVQHRSMVLLAGLGYLDNQEAYNISWKGTLIYFPHQSRFGFGASYSPLTKAGIVVGFKLN